MKKRIFHGNSFQYVGRLRDRRTYKGDRNDAALFPVLYQPQPCPYPDNVREEGTELLIQRRLSGFRALYIAQENASGFVQKNRPDGFSPSGLAVSGSRYKLNKILFIAKSARFQTQRNTPRRYAGRACSLYIFKEGMKKISVFCCSVS